MNAPVGLLASFFFEIGILQYQRAELSVDMHVWITQSGPTLFLPEKGKVKMGRGRPTPALKEIAARSDRRQVGFRGVTYEQRAEIKGIASDLNVPMGDVARKFLENGLILAQKGRLPDISPEFIARFYHDLELLENGGGDR
jgi:hypothetical protein